jgi:nitroreductase
MDNKSIIKAILRSQRCQRNWDLSQEIPEEDLEVIKTAVTQCPSKQNVTFYKPIFVTNRDVIQKIHDSSMLGGVVNKDTHEFSMKTQSQLLANLLVVLVEDFRETDIEHSPALSAYVNGYLAPEIEALHLDIYGNDREHMIRMLADDYKRDQSVAVGIAAGYMNLASSLMGYSTGCCQCFDVDLVKDLLGIKNNVLLIMGIGFKDKDRNRREHHMYSNEIFTSKNKYITVKKVS